MSSSMTSASISSEDCERERRRTVRETAQRRLQQHARTPRESGGGGSTHRAVLLEQLGLSQRRRATKLGVVVVTEHGAGSTAGATA